MKNIAIIPARGGSKRIPKKNIKSFLGKPIIAYSIEAAQKSKLFDEIVVSSDDPHILDIAHKYGATPVKRPNSLSDDNSTLFDVINHLITQQKIHSSSHFACIFATNPFITSELLKKAYSSLVEKDSDTILTVVKNPVAVSKLLSIKSGKIQRIDTENFGLKTQDLANLYYDAGMFYFCKTSVFLLSNSKRVCNGKIEPLILNTQNTHDIDTEQDWQTALVKFKNLSNATK